MRFRLSPAGWFWLVYLALIAAFCLIAWRFFNVAWGSL